MTHIKKYIVYFLIIVPFTSFSQNTEKIDSILSVVESVPDTSRAKLYCDLAELYRRERNALQTIEWAEKAIHLADSVNDLNSLARANTLLAGMYFRQDREKSFQYYLNILKAYRRAKDTTALIENIFPRAEIFAKTNPDQVLIIANEALELGIVQNNKETQAKAHSLAGVVRFNTGNYHEALESWQESLSLFEELDIKKEMSNLLINIGVIYKNWGNYQQATEYYQRNLDLQEQIGDTLQIARALSNMGNIFFYVGVDFRKALEYYKESLEYFKMLDNPLNVANIYNNIGLVYRELNDYGEALVNFRHALRIFQEEDYKVGIASSQNYMGNIYLEGGNYNDALRYSREALKINREIGDRKEMASNMRDIGRVHLKMRNYSQSLSYLRQSLELNQELGHKREVYEIYRDIAKVFEEQGDFETALKNFKEYNELKDSSISEEYLKQITEMETKYETERKERELELQKSQNARNEATIRAQEAENKRQRILLISFFFGLFIVTIFSVLFYRQFRAKQRANVLLEEQNIEISEQRDQIMAQKQEITDSITYASRIQKAILPPALILEKNLRDHFILYMPRDIVSGDYYWMTEVDSKTIVVAADCTGHGVPGAFMSMLGVSFLNEIVNKNKITTANEILNNLRTNVVASLHQTGEEGEAQDGMDLALLVIDHKKKEIQFSGAYNPLYLIRDNELMEIKADKMPIGIHFVRSSSFTNHVIPYLENDRLYIFSDGYMDQFGGEAGKKFMTRKFKNLIHSIHKKPMKKQSSILFDSFVEWRGEIEQIDDVLVIGLQL